MPFTKTYEVSKEFFNLFLSKTVKKKVDGDNREHPMLEIPLFTGETADFMVRYYKRSGESSVEDVQAYYPSIVLQDFQPEINKQLLWGKLYVEGVVDMINSKVDIISLPVPMIYEFKVNSITKRLKEAQGVFDWFMRNFDFNIGGYFAFNKFEIPNEGFVADVCPYTVEFIEVPREDGRFEYTFDFTVKTYLNPKSNKVSHNDTTGYSGGNFGDMLEKLYIALITRDIELTDNLIREIIYLE